MNSEDGKGEHDEPTDVGEDLARKAAEFEAVLREMTELRVARPTRMQMMIYGIVVGVTLMLSVAQILKVFDLTVPFWVVPIGIAYQIIVMRTWGLSQAPAERSRLFRDPKWAELARANVDEVKKKLLSYCVASIVAAIVATIVKLII